MLGYAYAAWEVPVFGTPTTEGDGIDVESPALRVGIVRIVEYRRLKKSSVVV